MVTCILYAIMDVIHTQVEMGYDQFQFCRQFDMKIKLWTSVHPNQLVSKVPKTLFVNLAYPFPCG
jgi:hypothetical protein